MLRTCWIGCLTVGLLYMMGCPDRASAEPESVDAVPGGTDFTLDLYRRIASEHEGENIFISPFSVRCALVMTWEGTRGPTAEQMAGALRLPDIERAQVHAGFGGMTRLLNAAEKPYEFNVANALWLERTFPFEQAYLDQITEAYGASLHQADFIHEYEAERKAINRWVEGQTEDKIRDLMPEGTVTQDTRLVLANAVYFKGRWAEQFDPERTRDETFTLIDGTHIKVPMMMRMDAEVGFGLGEGFAAIELPYMGDDLAMLILQPVREKTMLGIESELTPETLDAVLENMYEREWSMFVMPRFKIETDSYHLNHVLKAMGMDLVFIPGAADFTGMSPAGRQLYISNVMHKGYVDVNEEGTEAAAATGVKVQATFASSWMVDRPFLFMIRHRPSGEILFIGRVLDPRMP